MMLTSVFGKLLGRGRPGGRTRLIVLVPSDTILFQDEWDGLQADADPDGRLESVLVPADHLNDRVVREARTDANNAAHVARYYVVLIREVDATSEQDFEAIVEAYIESELEKPETADILEGYRSPTGVWVMTSLKEGWGMSYSTILTPKGFDSRFDDYRAVLTSFAGFH